MNWMLLKNSLWISGAATLLSVASGFFVAIALAGLEKNRRYAGLLAGAIILCIPSFLVVNGWLSPGAEGGILHGWSPIRLYSMEGTILLLWFVTWPVSALLIQARLMELDLTLLEADPALKGFFYIRKVLVPLSLPTVFLSGAVTLVICFNQFTIPVLLQTKVYPAELWVQFNTTFNYWKAWQLSWPIALAALLVLPLFFKTRVPWPRWNVSENPAVFRKASGGFHPFGIALLFGLGLVSLGIPLGQVVTDRRTWVDFFPALSAGKWAMAWSLLFAASTAMVVCALGWMMRQWKPAAAGWFAFFVPGIWIGILLLYLSTRPGMSWIASSVPLVILALSLRYFALGWTSFKNLNEEHPSEFREFARLNGVGGLTYFRKVALPLGRERILAVGYVVFLLCLWDVETILLLYPPGTETMATRIFNLLHYGHSAQVNALCLWLLLLAVAPLGGWLLISSRKFLLIPVLVLAAGGCSVKPPERNEFTSAFFSEVQVIGTRGNGPGQFNKPRSVAVDLEDNLYVVDMTGRVQKFSPEGKYLLQWQMPETDRGRPKGMSHDKEGGIIVLEPHYARVNHYDSSGKLRQQWGRFGTNHGEFSFPRAVAVTSAGDLLVSEFGRRERLQKFSAQGQELLLSVGEAGSEPGQFNRPEGLFVDSAGRILVADSCNHRVQIFDAAGKFLQALGTAGTRLGEMSYPYDVRVDSKGFLFVCEFGNSRIQIFDSSGKALGFIGGAGGEPGQFNNPWAIAMDSRENLYVADSMNHRVQKFVRGNRGT